MGSVWVSWELKEGALQNLGLNSPWQCVFSDWMFSREITVEVLAHSTSRSTRMGWPEHWSLPYMELFKHCSQVVGFEKEQSGTELLSSFKGHWGHVAQTLSWSSHCTAISSA